MCLIDAFACKNKALPQRYDACGKVLFAFLHLVRIYFL